MWNSDCDLEYATKWDTENAAHLDVEQYAAHLETRGVWPGRDSASWLWDAPSTHSVQRTDRRLADRDLS